MSGDWRSYDHERLVREYSPAATVDGVERYFAMYERRSLATRARFSPQRDVAYGDHPREMLDLFPASVEGAPLVLFIHGGYWRRFSKDEHSFTIEPFVARGAAAAVINYPLAPEASLDEIVGSVRRAVLWLHRSGARTHAATGRIVVTGHSAGGHLAGMMASTDWETYGIARDGSVPGGTPIRAIVPISGLFDLEPVRHTHVNDWMHLDEAAATRNSPIHQPNGAVRLVAGVGGAESSEFRRQTTAFVQSYNDIGGRARAIECPDRNHFDVLEDLANDDGPLARAVFELL